MTGLIKISTDLELRYGAATYNFRRFVDSRQYVVLENEETGEPWKLSMSEFDKLVRRKELVPSGGSQPAKALLDQPVSEVILDTSALPMRQRVQLYLRHTLIQRLKRAGVSHGQREKIAEKLPELLPQIIEQARKGKLDVDGIKFHPSASTIQRLWTSFERAGGNVAALASGHWFRQSAHSVHSKVDEVIEDCIARLYLQYKGPTLKETWGEARKQLNKLVESGILTAQAGAVSYATVHRRAKELDPYFVTARREGQARARVKHRATIDGTRATRALERLEVDHTLLDWYVLCDLTGLPLGRPTLTIIVDSYSKYIVGLYVSFNGPGIATVLKAIKHSILPKTQLSKDAGCENPWVAFGVGETFLLDNGLEFHSQTFQRVTMELCIDVEYCPVRCPWVKPSVERTFADLDHIGIPHGRVNKNGSNGIPVKPKDCAVIPFSRFAQGLVIWACDIHGHHTNRMTLCRPAEIFVESLARCPAPTMPMSLHGLDLIAAMSQVKTISHGGVERRGITYAGAGLPELMADVGAPFRGLIKWDPDNLGTMLVQNPRSMQWHALASTRPDFAEGLTEHQLRTIRRALGADANRGDRVDQMIRMRDNFRQAWLEPLAVKNVNVNPADARKFAAVSATAAHAVRSPQPSTTILTPDEFGTYEPHEIPEFETL